MRFMPSGSKRGGELERFGPVDSTGLKELCGSKPRGPRTHRAKSYGDAAVSKTTCGFLRVGTGAAVR